MTKGKLLKTFLAASVILTMLTGCGGKDKEKENTTKPSNNPSSADTTLAPPEPVTQHTTASVNTDSAGEFTSEFTTLAPQKTLPVIKNFPTIAPNIAGYKAINKDTKGWIKISNTFINYPIFQTDDNSLYLDHDYNKQKSKGGSLFFDYRNDINNDDNLLIYGHNMADGTYFACLNYYNSFDFYKSNPIIQFNTENSAENYAIVSIFYINASKEQDNGKLYPYHNVHNFEDSDFATWKEEITKRSLYDSKIDFTENDKYITLSTCSNKLTNGRFIVIGKKVTNGDVIDPNKFEKRTNVYYPQEWFTKYGGSYRE